MDYRLELLYDPAIPPLGIYPKETKTFIFIFCLLIFKNKRDRAWAGEGQREREPQNPKQAPGSELSAQSPTQGSHRPRDHDLSRSWTLNRLSHPGTPYSRVISDFQPWSGLDIEHAPLVSFWQYSLLVTQTCYLTVYFYYSHDIVISKAQSLIFYLYFNLKPSLY